MHHLTYLKQQEALRHLDAPLPVEVGSTHAPANLQDFQQDPNTGLYLRSLEIVQPQPPALYQGPGVVTGPIYPEWTSRVQPGPGVYIPHYRYGIPNASLHPAPPRPSPLKAVLVVSALAAGALIVWKFGQALTDEVYNARLYPTGVRNDLIADHIKRHGSYCTSCGRYTTDWAIDHRHPWARGGLTSRANAQVLCGPCNSSKGANLDIFDALLGRSSLGGFLRAMLGFR